MLNETSNTSGLVKLLLKITRYVLNNGLIFEKGFHLSIRIYLWLAFTKKYFHYIYVILLGYYTLCNTFNKVLLK